MKQQQNRLSLYPGEANDQVTNSARLRHHFLHDQLDDHVRWYVATLPHDLLKATTSLGYGIHLGSQHIRWRNELKAVSCGKRSIEGELTRPRTTDHENNEVFGPLEGGRIHGIHTKDHHPTFFLPKQIFISRVGYVQRRNLLLGFPLNCLINTVN